LTSFFRISISSLLPVSIDTRPFQSDLRELIHTLISVGFILVFTMSLIVSGDLLSLDVTVSV
jgi:hypothetical protein